MFFRKFRTLGIMLIIMVCMLSACAKKEGAEAVFAIDDYEDDLAVYFFHMEDEEKTGESIFIETPEGTTILIDAGTPDAGPLVDEHLETLGVDQIDYVMPSHPHIDHIGGLHTIFTTKEIGKVIETDIPHDTATYEPYKELMEEEGIDVEIGEAGDVLELEDDLTLEIINTPKGTNKDSLPEGYSQMKAGYINNVSMVIKLTHKDNTFLFTGDIYLDQELELVDEYGDELQSDVLVAPHHGDDTSSSNIFIETVNPDFAMIPSNNLYSIDVMERYEALGSEVYHSAFNGTVVLISDGDEIKAIPEKEKDEEEEE